MEGQRTIANSSFAAEKRALNALIADFTSIGLGEVAGGLPHIAIIGNQSAAKSSCVEAISGIRVPRDKDTCTRCPFEIRMLREDSDWSCRIKLRFDYDDSQETLKKPQACDFGALIDESAKGLVEDRLRRAQLAILNGLDSVINHQRFLDGDLDRLKREALDALAFSHNTVIVEIRGPEVTDLTFVDLPGIVADERHAIVESLVNKQIESNCLILLTLSMSDDLANQGARTLAIRADPKGDRTIGVLTKPDLVEEGLEDSWLNMLKGTRAPLKHGYFAVKHPDFRQRSEGMTADGAQQAEEQFFFTTKPWATTGNAVKARLGTPRLTQALSDMLRVFIRQQLPRIEKLIDADRRSIAERLRALPAEPPRDPAAHMVFLCTDLKARLSACVGGTGSEKKMLQEARKIYESLSKAIEGSTPIISHLARPSEGQTNVSSDDYTFVADSDTTRTPPAADADDLDQSLKLLFPEREIIYLAEVLRIKEDAMTSELPGWIPYDAQLQLIHRAYERWNADAAKAFDAIPPLFRKHAERYVNELFGSFREHLAVDAVMAIVDAEIEKLSETVKSQVVNLVAMDKRPFTLNRTAYIQLAQIHLSELRRQRSADPACTCTGAVSTPQWTFPADQSTQAEHPESTWTRHVNTVIASLAQLGYKGITENDFSSLLPKDDWEDELRLCANAEAYWSLSLKIVVDEIPKLIHHRFFEPLPQTIIAAVSNELGLGDTHRCARLLAEDPKVEAERKKLKEEEVRNDEARKALREFYRKKQNGDW